MYTSTVVSALAVLLSVASAAPAEKRYTDVSFTNSFPAVIYPGDVVDLSWTGGDGTYTVYPLYGTPEWSIGEDSTQTSYVWHAFDGNFEPNTTVTFGLSDGNSNTLSPIIPTRNRD